MIEQIIDRLELLIEENIRSCGEENSLMCHDRNFGVIQAIECIKKMEKQLKTDWIPCEERLPDAEEEVYILAKRKYRDGDFKYITTTAMYEDGTIRENDSCWYWEDIEGEWDEEEDCYIIPKGWWECKHYNPDNCYNNAVDDEVIAWQPLPKPYKKEGAE